MMGIRTTLYDYLEERATGDGETPVHEGSVVRYYLDKYTWIEIKPKEDNTLEVRSSNGGIVVYSHSSNVIHIGVGKL